MITAASLPRRGSGVPESSFEPGGRRIVPGQIPLPRSTSLPGSLRVMIVDEPSASELAANLIAHRGWEAITVDAATLQGSELRHQIEQLGPSVVLVDPNALAWQPWQWIPLAWAELATIVWTRSATTAQRARALRAGVDYWLNKPSALTHADLDELAATIEVVVRRLGEPERRIQPAETINAGELEIDTAAMRCEALGQPLELTAREFMLLAALAEQPGQVLSRDEIHRRAWGTPLGRGDRSVDTVIRRLRVKLALASPRWQYVHTHPRVGYRFQPVEANL